MKKILSVILAAALLISLSAPVFAEDKLPTKWDLTAIYPSAEEWQKDYDKVMDMLNEYERFRGTLNNAQGIWDYLQFAYFTELTRLQNKLVEYAFLGSSLDATDPVFAEMNARLSTMNAREGQLTAFAIPEIFSLPLEEREAIFADPLFRDYTYAVKDFTDPDKQPLGEEAAETAATLSMALGYPQEIFQRMVYVEMPYLKITMPDGTEREVNDQTFGDILYSDEYSDEFKAEATRLYYSRAIPYISTLAKLLEGNAKAAYAGALLNHHETTREDALDAYDVDPRVYDLLVEAAHEGAADNQRYLKTHARGLGLEKQYSYDMYDYISDFDPGKTSYDDAVDEVTEALGILGEEYIETFRSIIESGQVDVYPSDTKTTGAFEFARSYDFQPWVLFNYNGMSDDISTIAHEMGHAVYEAFSTANQPVQYRSPTIFTHEVASTTNELLYYSYKMQNAQSDDERLYYLENVLSRFETTFFSQMFFAEFEDWFYQIVEDGGALDPEAMSEKYASLFDVYEGGEILRVEENKYRWATVPHFYYVYYVYQYASSVCYAASIAERIVNGEEGAVEDYLAFLKAGRSGDPQTLLSIAGIDPLDADTYREGVAFFSGLVDEYERLVDAKLAADAAA